MSHRTGPPRTREASLGTGIGVQHNTTDDNDGGSSERRTAFTLYLLFLISYLTVQFGHGSNIGVAVSLKENSKAMNLALGSWVMVGVCVGLLVTPWVHKTFGIFQVCAVCVVLDILVILLMLWPGISLPQIYFIRFLVGFFEAPFLPYLQEWLAHFGKHTWNVWNTVLHAMVPLGENLGYILAQELVEAGLSWQWAFAGQAAVLTIALVLVWVVGGSRYLDLSKAKSAHSTFSDDEGDFQLQRGVNSDEDQALDDHDTGDAQVEYPVTERWAVYWATNCSLASQLGFLSGSKYVIRDYATNRGFTLHCILFSYSAIALVGPALGGSIAMSGSLVRPDQWSQHKRTLAFLACTSTVAAGIAVTLHYTPEGLFWPALFAAFIAAGGVYPAAQGIINIALTESRVVEASVWQVQCNNVLFAMPMPYLIGKSMDTFSVETSWQGVILLQVLAAAGFVFAIAAATFTEERNTWHWMMHRLPEDGPCGNMELSRSDNPDGERERFLE